VTVALAVVEPPAPVHVSVYVVVVVGETGSVPPLAGVCVPSPLFIEAEVELVQAYVSVELFPAIMLVGEALRAAVGATGAVTVTVALAVAEPPPPVQVTV
jgi:hypothetical protein